VGSEEKDMVTFEAIRTLLAVRAFRDAPIPEDVVREIVEAGHLTASAGNGQPWHFIVVQDKDTVRQLGALSPSGRYIAQAQLAVVVATDANSAYGVSDASRAIQDMLLAAWSRGVGGNWVGARDAAAIKPVLGIPEGVDLLAIVPFGYPAQQVGAGKKQRKPLGEVASRERFGQPFA
jgi:nitroreductase